ncbi:unnamed protein product [Echinostoma caproni]|uniref:Uncharacterized protein n=1 Tax=Echinostoma caproni TaxID=27848 RepID=A0A182ZZG6_9TREM|nr:unnamed protein product [Echinostoma caproni]
MDSAVSSALEEWNSVRKSIDERIEALIRNEHFLGDVYHGISSTASYSFLLPSVTQVENMIKKHFGQAMEVTLLRGDGIRLPVLVPISARVLDLRRAIQEVILSYLNRCLFNGPGPRESTEKREKPITGEAFDLIRREQPEAEARLSLRFTSPRFLSWRSIWRTQCLAWVTPSSTQLTLGRSSVVRVLDDLRMPLLDTGIRNGATISFVSKLKKK